MTVIATINEFGVLVLTPETTTEAFAIHHWHEIAMKDTPRDEDGMPYLRHERLTFGQFELAAGSAA